MTSELKTDYEIDFFSQLCLLDLLCEIQTVMFHCRRKCAIIESDLLGSNKPQKNTILFVLNHILCYYYIKHYIKITLLCYIYCLLLTGLIHCWRSCVIFESTMFGINKNIVNVVLSVLEHYIKLLLLYCMYGLYHYYKLSVLYCTCCLIHTTLIHCWCICTNDQSSQSGLHTPQLSAVTFVLIYKICPLYYKNSNIKPGLIYLICCLIQRVLTHYCRGCTHNESRLFEHEHLKVFIKIYFTNYLYIFQLEMYTNIASMCCIKHKFIIYNIYIKYYISCIINSVDIYNLWTFSVNVSVMMLMYNFYE